DAIRGPPCCVPELGSDRVAGRFRPLPSASGVTPRPRRLRRSGNEKGAEEVREMFRTLLVGSVTGSVLVDPMCRIRREISRFHSLTTRYEPRTTLVQELDWDHGPVPIAKTPGTRIRAPTQGPGPEGAAGCRPTALRDRPDCDKTIHQSFDDRLTYSR